MKLDKDKFNGCVNSAKQCVQAKKQHIKINEKNEKIFLIWPLFFSKGLQPKEESVDVCTSALGTISCAYFVQKEDSSILSTIKDGISTILFVRNQDGSWPSKVSLVAKDTVSMEGVINDTYFALSALIHIGFITNQPIIGSIFDHQNNKELKNLNDRLDIISVSVGWLLDNRVNQGWGYTGINYLEDGSAKKNLPAYVTPSLNATLVLSKILQEVKIVNPKLKLISQMEEAIDETINWLCEIQNEDGGFGIKRGERSRIGNTARAIVVLCSVNVSNEKKLDKTIYKAVKWLIRNYNPKKILFEDVSEDFSQIIIGNKPIAYKRSIIHESFLEPLVIDALRLYYKKYLCRGAEKRKSSFSSYKIYLVLKSACEEMLNRQEEAGDLKGAVKSRRSAQNEWYTMYTCSDLICSLVPFIEDCELFERVIKVNLVTWRWVIACVSCVIVLIIPLYITDNLIWLLPIIVVLNPLAGNFLWKGIQKLFDRLSIPME